MSAGSQEGDALFTRRLPARPEVLKQIRKAVADALKGSALSRECQADVVLAVDEACQNVIRHAYRDCEGDLVVRIDRTGEGIEIAIRDFAPPVDPEKIRPRPLDDVRPGGLGTHFIRETMDEVVYQCPPEGEGNLLRMVKKIG